MIRTNNLRQTHNTNQLITSLKMLCICILLFCNYNSIAQKKLDNSLLQPNSYKLSFYLGNSPRTLVYSILVDNDSVKAENYNPTRSKGNSSFHGKLSSVQKTKLYSLYQKIDTIPLTKKNPYLEVIDDGWVASLAINKVIRYEDFDFAIEATQPDIKRLIEYIIQLGNIKIDFR